MSGALPTGLVVGIATFVSYLVAYRGSEATPVQQIQASTTALITLLITAGWVLAVVARPYEWWRLTLVICCGLAYVAIFAIPLTREEFLLDPSNVALTSLAFGVGALGAAAIEVMWWARGVMLGERPKLWREPLTTTMAQR